MCKRVEKVSVEFTILHLKDEAGRFKGPEALMRITPVRERADVALLAVQLVA
jgi:hypothetical protein